MATELSGAMRRRRQSLKLRILAGVAAVALVLPLAAQPAAAAKHPKKPVAVAAKSVPLPHPSPLRASAARPVTANAPDDTSDSTDTIASLIAKDDSAEATASEDSDAPEAARSAPEFDRTPPQMPPAKSGPPINSVGLKLALKLLDNNDPGAATLAAYALPDRTDIKIVNWLIATGGYSGVPSSSLADLQRKLTDWPGQSLMRLRYEQALVREKPAPAAVVAAFGNGRPTSDDGKVLLASAYLGLGRTDDAAALIRAVWRDFESVRVGREGDPEFIPQPAPAR